MHESDPRRNAYEAIAPEFDRLMNPYDLERRLWLVFEPLWIAGGVSRALDVGCGTGWFSRAARERLPSATLVSFDISQSLARLSRERANGEGVRGDACALPFDDASFDLVLSSECIEHCPDPLEVLREMARVLRPGGTLIVTSPNRLWHFSVVLANRLGLRPFHGFENWVWPGTAAAELERAGLSILARRGVHLFPFQVKALQPLLRWIDERAPWLGPAMINFGIAAQRPA